MNILEAKRIVEKAGYKVIRESPRRGHYRRPHESPILPIGRLRSNKIFDHEELKDFVAYVFNDYRSEVQPKYKVILSAGVLSEDFDKDTLYHFIHDQSRRPLFSGTIQDVLSGQDAFDKYGSSSAYVFK
jgi:hypothetical protein